MIPTEVFARLARKNGPGRTEADIQSDVQTVLLQGNFGLDEPRLEEPTGDGSQRRIDVAIGATVIEVKKDLNEPGAVAAATPQLAGYVSTRSAQLGTRYNGVLTDGRLWLLFESDPSTGEFTQRARYLHGSQETSGALLVEWLQSVLATQRDMTPNARTIESHLGASSPAYAQDHAFLTGMYERVQSDPTVQLKRALWARLLRSALGTSFEDDAHLFVDHTLLVIEAAAIGHAIMGIDPADLIDRPANLLDGYEFTEASIGNVIEADFFAWVLEDVDGAQFVAQIIRRVTVFDWHATEHDVLKVLYESVINAATRKNLGEYYTPDWLAEGIVQTAIKDPLNQRTLDPACGSGTFLYHAVRRFCQAADEQGWENRHTVEAIQSHVRGMDIHPVSVVLARITYLLALGDRLSGERGAFTVPVYLGDSMQWSQDTGLNPSEIRVRVDSQDLAPQQDTLLDIAETLVFPLKNVDDPDTFDRLVHDLTERAKQHVDPTAKKPSPSPILKKYGVTDKSDEGVLTETFTLLCDLHAKGRDSIWGYFVRNQVRPTWLSMADRRVDVLIGNPPWVPYRDMTPPMQEQFRRFSEQRNLWHGGHLSTQQDLVALFIARATELYLRERGTFAFVVPLAVLSRKQYEGFRAGKWGGALRCNFLELWDMESVRPNTFFPVPSAVLFAQCFNQTREIGAEPHRYGFPREKSVYSGLRDSTGWKNTRARMMVSKVENVAIAIEDPRTKTGYAAISTSGANIWPRFLFFVEEQQATNKLGQAANRVRVTSKRSRQEKPPYKSRPSLTGTVEKRFVLPVHMGSTIAPHRALTPETAILPVKDGAVLSESQIQNADGLSTWWSQAKDEWALGKTKSSTLDLLDQINYQNKLSRQLNGSSFRVVYSKAGNTLAAAYIDDPAIIVEQALYWIPVGSVDEARYLTAILNAPATTQAVSVYQSRGQLGARHFDSYVWKLGIPTYDPRIDSHVLLSSLGAAAEEIAEQVALPSGTGFQRARKMIREALAEDGVTGKIDALVVTLLNLSETGKHVPIDPHLELKAEAVRARKALVVLPGIDAPFAQPDVTIDLDCEFDPRGVVLWGATITRAGETEYKSFGSALNDEKEAAVEIANWLRAEYAKADAAGHDIRVFHYGTSESVHLSRILGSAAVKDVIGRFVDMLPTLRSRCFAPSGYGLKTIAPTFGASWRTPGATGVDALRWIAEAREGDQSAWARLVAYNEDDTRATRAVRVGVAKECE